MESNQDGEGEAVSRPRMKLARYESTLVKKVKSESWEGEEEEEKDRPRTGERDDEAASSE